MNDIFNQGDNTKRLIKWSLRASKLNNKDRHYVPQCKEGDIWDVSIGHGVGSEVYGKGDLFKRPVLVVTRFNSNRFLGIPLTTNAKYEGFYAVPTYFNQEVGKAMVDQQSSYDNKRLIKKLGMLDPQTLNIVRQKISPEDPEGKK